MKNKAFTLVEMIVSLFICSLILVYLLPNLVRQYVNLHELEENLTMKEILYEELSSNKGKEFTSTRDNYTIVVKKNSVKIIDNAKGKELSYN